MKDEIVYICYCSKCGSLDAYEGKKEICSFCGTEEIPTKYDWTEWLFRENDTAELESTIFNTLVKTNPLFDQEMYESRETKEHIIAYSKSSSSNIPHCPTCNSTNVQKISVAKKATGFALVGIFSSNFGKTMQCKNCGYKW